jgi:hypothetical protein
METRFNLISHERMVRVGLAKKADQRSAEAMRY